MLKMADASTVESFRPNRGPNWLMVIGAALIMTLSIVYGISGSWLVGTIGLCGGILFLISPVQYLLWCRPTLVIDSTGFILTLPSFSRDPYSSGTVAWRDIDNIVVVGGSRYIPFRTIQVRLKNLSGVHDRRGNGAVSSLIKIPEIAIDISSSELVSKMLRYCSP
jgi:hypothetical protein